MSQGRTRPAALFSPTVPLRYGPRRAAVKRRLLSPSFARVERARERRMILQRPPREGADRANVRTGAEPGGYRSDDGLLSIGPFDPSANGNVEDHASPPTFGQKGTTLYRPFVARAAATT